MIDHDVDGPLWAVLGHPQGLCGWPRAALRASVDGPGSLSGPLWVVLGRSQGLCGRSWVALRGFVGGPGSLSGPPWAILGRNQAGKWPKPEREAEKWPKPEREQGALPPEAPRALPRPLFCLPIFSID